MNRSLVRYIVIVAACAVATGAAQAAPRVPTHVACVGDSITAGVGASSGNTNYPAVLQGLLGAGTQVKNFGVSGATTLSAGDLPYVKQGNYTSATSFVSGAGATAIVDVIIMLGTNDSKDYNWVSGGKTRADQFRTDCAAMVDHFAQLPTHPLVYLALPPVAFENTYKISGTVIHDQILPILKDVAASKGIPTIDINTPTTGHSEMFPDGVHPNDTGYKLLAQTMRDGLAASAGTGGAGGNAGTGGVGGTGGSGGGSGMGGNGVGGNGGAGGARDGGADSASGGTLPDAGGKSGDAAGGTVASGGAAGGAGGSAGNGGAGGNGGLVQPRGGSTGGAGSGGIALGGASGASGGEPSISTSSSTSSGCSCAMGGSSRVPHLTCVALLGLRCFKRRRR